MSGKRTKDSSGAPHRNPVKKYSDQLNRPATHKDRKKELKKRGYDLEDH